MPEIDRIEKVMGIETDPFSVTILSKGFIIHYKDGTQKVFDYHSPVSQKTMDIMHKQGRIKFVTKDYPTIEGFLEDLISELRRDGKDAGTLATKAYEEERRKKKNQKK